jgi:uncharacterized protein involved in cysteine biosynthesis
MPSLIQEIMSPGGGVMLIPFVRVVISILLVLCIMGFVANVARVHMVVLGVLSAGLLFSLSLFEREFEKVRASNSKKVAITSVEKESNKTD